MLGQKARRAPTAQNTPDGKMPRTTAFKGNSWQRLQTLDDKHLSHPAKKTQKQSFLFYADFSNRCIQKDAPIGVGKRAPKIGRKAPVSRERRTGKSKKRRTGRRDENAPHKIETARPRKRGAPNAPKRQTTGQLNRGKSRKALCVESGRPIPLLFLCAFARPL